MFCPFCASIKTCLDRGLDAQKRTVEPGLPHQVEQLVVFGEVDAGFGDESERTPVSLLPFRQMRQHKLDVFLVADEVVVDDEHRSPPTRLLQHIELRKHLLVALGSRYSTINLDDVAKLAVEWAPARVLDRHRAVASHVGKLEVRDRSKRQLGSFGCVVNCLGFAALQIVDKLRERFLRFTKNQHDRRPVRPSNVVVT